MKCLLHCREKETSTIYGTKHATIILVIDFNNCYCTSAIFNTYITTHTFTIYINMFIVFKSTK